MLSAMYFVHKDEFVAFKILQRYEHLFLKILLHDMSKTKGGLYSLCFHLN